MAAHLFDQHMAEMYSSPCPTRDPLPACDGCVIGVLIISSSIISPFYWKTLESGHSLGAGVALLAFGRTWLQLGSSCCWC